MEQAAPIAMISSRLTGWPRPSNRVLAAAMGPGVGGMKQWEMYRPIDSATVAAMQLAWQVLKQVIEPSSAIALAAVLAQPQRFAGRRVGVILSGGNVDLEVLPWQR